MRTILDSVKIFLKSEDGPTSVEYCVMLAFVFLVVIFGVTQLGQTTHGLYTESLDEMP